MRLATPALRPTRPMSVALIVVLVVLRRTDPAACRRTRQDMPDARRARPRSPRAMGGLWAASTPRGVALLGAGRYEWHRQAPPARQAGLSPVLLVGAGCQSGTVILS